MMFDSHLRTVRTRTPRGVVVLFVAIASCSPAPGSGQQPAVPSASAKPQGAPERQIDPAVYRGAGLAHLGCPQCHDIGIAGAGPAANAAAPDFVSVANREGMTAARIRQWLRGSHPTMPGYFMDDQTNSDLAAYIMSLRHKT